VKLKTLKLAPVVVAAGVIGVVCALQLARLDFFDRLERMTYDWRLRQAARFTPVVATNLGFVSISDQTIEEINKGLLGPGYGLYWPRFVYGKAARELAAQGAKVVAFDVLFGELRPDHPKVNLPDWTEISSDDYFAQLVGKAGNVILAAEEDVIPPPLFRTNALALGDITAEPDSDGILRRARAFRTYRRWHRVFQAIEDNPDYGVDLRKATIEPGEIILNRRDGLPPIKVPIDSEGRFDVTLFLGTNIPPRIERHPKAFTDERVWHMGIVLAAQALGLDLDKADVDLDAGRITLHGPGGIERIIPVDHGGYFYIDWCIKINDHQHLTQDPLEAILRQDKRRVLGETNGLRDDWKGKLAIVGSVAVGNDLADHGATPLQKQDFLVSKHWNVANSVLTGRFIHPASQTAAIIMICLVGAIVATLTVRIERVLVATAWVTAVLFAYVAVALGLFVWLGYWLPMVLPLGGGLLTMHGCVLAYLVVFERADKRRVKSVFGKMVSQDVMAELLKTENPSLAGARRSVTVLFADIRGFTEMTDVNRDVAAAYIKEHGLKGEAAEAVFEAQAQETLATVNLYLRLIAESVLRHNGTVDKFIGDCVMAFWGAPVPNPRHALHCIHAAIDAQRAIYRLNQEREIENQRRAVENARLAAAGQPLLPALAVLSVGSGINTGAVTVGLMGTEERQNYTVFGRDVNLASRLETVSGRGRIIISEGTLAEIIQDDPSLALSCIELPPEKVKGIRDAVHIYEVPWRTGEYASKGGASTEFTHAPSAIVPPVRAEKPTA
jgi:class 3 adenylate cyclase/CHASE2 domain-containing sensor protein